MNTNPYNGGAGVSQPGRGNERSNSSAGLRPTEASSTGNAPQPHYQHLQPRVDNLDLDTYIMSGFCDMAQAPATQTFDSQDSQPPAAHHPHPPQPPGRGLGDYDPVSHPSETAGNETSIFARAGLSPNDEPSHGTLVISASGRSKYLGPSAASEWLKDVGCLRFGPS